MPCSRFGGGSELNHQGTAGFSPWFHVPGFHFGYLFFDPQPFGCGPGLLFLNGTSGGPPVGPYHNLSAEGMVFAVGVFAFFWGILRNKLLQVGLFVGCWPVLACLFLLFLSLCLFLSSRVIPCFIVFILC